MHIGTIATFQPAFSRSAEGSTRQVDTSQKFQSEDIFTSFYMNLWNNSDTNYTALLREHDIWTIMFV